MLDESRLAEIKDRLRPFELAEVRANELEAFVPRGSLFVGMLGVEAGVDSFAVVDDLVIFREITNPPGAVHVCQAGVPGSTDYFAIARYSTAVTAELSCGVLSRDVDLEPRFLHGLAWHTVALLKLRGHQTLLCPASSTVSWDLVQTAEAGSVRFLLLDDMPRQIRTRDAISVTAEDLTWVRNNWDRAFHLRDAATSKRFGLAFNLAYSWNHQTDCRLAVATLWAGLEALFGVRTDRPVTERLVQRIADWIPTAPVEGIRDLYGHRCDAVHGRWMKDQEIVEVLRRSELLLTQSLIRCIESESRTLPDPS